MIYIYYFIEAVLQTQKFVTCVTKLDGANAVI